MKEIPLTRGYVALVDDEDYERVSAHKWFASVRKRTDGSLSVYAVRNAKKSPGIYTSEYMHRFIVGQCTHRDIDHIDGNPLNNTRMNLRPATRSENMRNMRRTRVVLGNKTSSNAKGVYWHKKAKKWAAQATLNGVVVYLGLHENEESAAAAYRMFANENFGVFAKI